LLYKLVEEVMGPQQIISYLSIDLYELYDVSKKGNRSHEEQYNVSG